MYATKRRQRNFKRTTTDNNNKLLFEKQQKQPLLLNNNNNNSNPSKRHRERLNGELETVASLLPYNETIIQRLDKLSVLRLAVSYLQIKAHFQVCSQLSLLQPNGRCFSHPYFSNNNNNSFFSIPSLWDSSNKIPIVDLNDNFYSSLAQKALGGFLLILHLDGDIFYLNESIENYLGFQQSDVLHQSIFEMIHSEDRDELKCLLLQIQQLSIEENNEILNQWDFSMVLRFRCLLDNTCGFVRIELNINILNIHSHQSNQLSTFNLPSQSFNNNNSLQNNISNGRGRKKQQITNNNNNIEIPSSYSPLLISSNKHWNWALIAICIPFVPPLQMDIRIDDPIIKSKHSLDMGIQSMDSRLRQILEINENNNDYLLLPSNSNNLNNNNNIRCSSSSRSFYNFIHPSDVKYFSDSHEMVIKSCSSGLMIYRLISTKNKNIYYIQTSFRLFYKSSKPDSIGANHRILTEVDGESLLEKRNNIKSKFLSFDDILLQSPRIFQQTTTTNNNNNNLIQSLKINNNLLFKDNENKNDSNNKEIYEKNKKILSTTKTTNISQQIITNKKQKKIDKNIGNKTKIIKKLISTKNNNEKSSNNEKNYSNINKTINYGENLNNNIEINNNNFLINQQQQLDNLHISQNFNNSTINKNSSKLSEMTTTTTTTIASINNNNNNNLLTDTTAAMISSFPYYYYYYCISPTQQQQNLFGSLIMDLTNIDNNNNENYWTSAVMAAAAVSDIDENNINEMFLSYNNNNNLQNQDFHFPSLQNNFESDLASSSSLFYWPSILPQTNSSNLELITTTTSSIISPQIYSLPQQQQQQLITTTTNYDDNNNICYNNILNNNKDSINFISSNQQSEYINNNICSFNIPSTSNNTIILETTKTSKEIIQQQKQQTNKTNLINQQCFNSTLNQTFTNKTCFEHPKTFQKQLLEQKHNNNQQTTKHYQKHQMTENNSIINISPHQNIETSTIPSSSSNNSTTTNSSSFRFFSDVAQTLFG